MAQGFSEEAGHDELGVDEEADLLLHQAGAGDPAAHKLVGEVHLQKASPRSKRLELGGT